MPPFVVRAAVADDAYRIAQLVTASRSDMLGDLVSAKTRERAITLYCSRRRIEQEIEPSGSSWLGWLVAEDHHGQLLGAVAGGLTQTGIAEVYEIHAAAGFQHHPAGGSLLQEVTHQHLALGATEQWASTYAHNAVMRAVLEASGFSLHQTVKPFDGIGTAEGLMVVRYRRLLTGHQETA